MTEPPVADTAAAAEQAAVGDAKKRHPVVLVHGGAWNMPAYFEDDYVAGVEAAAMAGYRALLGQSRKDLSARIAASGGATASPSAALKAVETAVRCMEDTPIFNAGTGSSLTVEGKVEMDAIIMDGRSLGVGAVSSLTVAKNAVSVARLVMEHSRHGFLTGAGADGFAVHMGANLASQADLHTEQAMIKLLAARNAVSYSRMLEAAAATKQPAKQGSNAAQKPEPVVPVKFSSPQGESAPLASPVAAQAAAAAAAEAPDAPVTAASKQAAKEVKKAEKVGTCAPTTNANVGVVVTGTKILPMPAVQQVIATSVLEPIAARIRAHKRTTRAARRANANSTRSPRNKKAKATIVKASPKETRARRGKRARDADADAGADAAPADETSPPKPTKQQRVRKGRKAAAAAAGEDLPNPDLPMDTVGAVALDLDGNVAAATSTGGTTNKAPGRVGDAPLTGSGAYADNDIGAVSTTGQGEAIMRVCLALNALNRHKAGVPVRNATKKALRYMRERVGGVGGLIMVNMNGEWAATCTTKRMAWACVDNGTLYSGVTNGSSTPYKAIDVKETGSVAHDEEDTTALGPAGCDLNATFQSIRNLPAKDSAGVSQAARDGDDDLLS